MSLFCKCQVQEESRGGCNRLFRGVFFLSDKLRKEGLGHMVYDLEVKSVGFLSFEDPKSNVRLFVLTFCLLTEVPVGVVDKEGLQ